MSRSLSWLLALAPLAACSPEIPSPKRTCWELATADYTDSCNPQACFDKVHETDVKSATGPGLVCNPTQATCDVPPPDQLSQDGGPQLLVEYDFDVTDGKVLLTFDNRILLGYSLENFRKYSVGGSYMWIDFPYSTEVASGTLEFLSYEAPILHMRVEGDVTQKREAVPTTPYSCGGPLSGTCSTGWCEYAPGTDADAGVPIHVVADLEVPIQQPTPSP